MHLSIDGWLVPPQRAPIRVCLLRLSNCPTPNTTRPTGTAHCSHTQSDYTQSYLFFQSNALSSVMYSFSSVLHLLMTVSCCDVPSVHFWHGSSSKWPGSAAFSLNALMNSASYWWWLRTFCLCRMPYPARAQKRGQPDDCTCNDWWLFQLSYAISGCSHYFNECQSVAIAAHLLFASMINGVCSI